MAITRKPSVASIPSTADIHSLINKGGSTAKSEAAASKEPAVVLRIPAAVLEQVDAAVKARPIRIPRHTWLLEAIYEKLSKETGK